MGAEPGVLLRWDTDFWGVVVGRVTSRTLTRERWAALDAWAGDGAVDCLYFLAQPDDSETIGIAQEAVERKCGVRLEPEIGFVGEF